MVNIKLTDKDFEELMSYYLQHKNYGKLKYFWEVSVPDNEYEQFLKWLNKCERAELTFAFAVIERYEGYKLLYGFTNFEVLENDNIKCFDFAFENDDILYDRFTLWKEESSHFIMPLSLKVYFEVMKRITSAISNIKPFNPSDISDVSDSSDKPETEHE